MIIQEAQLPIREDIVNLAKANNLDPVELALYIGEDFELVLTINPEKWETVKTRCRELNLNITQIGKVVADKKVMMKTKKGTLVELEKKGYDQFIVDI